MRVKGDQRLGIRDREVMVQGIVLPVGVGRIMTVRGGAGERFTRYAVCQSAVEPEALHSRICMDKRAAHGLGSRMAL